MITHGARPAVNASHKVSGINEKLSCLLSAFDSLLPLAVPDAAQDLQSRLAKVNVYASFETVTTR